MGTLLSRIAQTIATPMNKEVVDHIPTTATRKIWQAFEQRIRAAAEALPASIEFVGVNLVSVQDEVHSLLRQASANNRFDVTTSNVRLVRTTLRYNGIEVAIPANLPFVDASGTIAISGNAYGMAFGMMDGTFSSSSSSVYCRLNRDKFPVSLISYRFKYNGDTIPVTMPYINLMKRKAGRMRPDDVHTTVGLYLFSLLGVKETFTKFGMEILEVGKKLPYIRGTTVVSSSRFATQQEFLFGYANLTDYELRINGSSFTPSQLGIIGSFFYYADAYPHKFQNLAEVDFMGAEQWTIMLGIAIADRTAIRDAVRAGREIPSDFGFRTKAIQHQTSLTSYIDAVLLDIIEIEYGTKVKNFIAEGGFAHAMIYVSLNFYDWTANRGDFSDYVGKRVEVNYYLLLDLIIAFNTLVFTYQQLDQSNRLTVTSFTDTAKRSPMTRQVFNLPAMTNIFRMVITGSDQRLYSLLAMRLQTHGEGAVGHAKRDNSAAMPVMVPSAVMACSLQSITGSAPTGEATVNPFIALDENHLVVVPDRWKQAHVGLMEVFGHKALRLTQSAANANNVEFMNLLDATEETFSE